MTQEDKKLLLRDLCARLPYNVLVHIYDIDVCDYDNYLCEDDLAKFRINSIQIKPYLHPMSSMTEEEKKEFEALGWRVDELDDNFPWPHSTLNVIKGIDWLNAHHFDYRGLIEKRIALEAPKDMY